MSDLYPSILPVDHVSARDALGFWEGCLDRRLMIRRCKACGYWIHFPKGMCPSCWSDAIVLEDVCGSGTLFTWVIEPDGRIWAIVELDEQVGLRLPASLIEIDDPYIGMRLRLEWLEYQGIPVPAFRSAR